MKFLNRWHSLFFIISGQLFCSIPSTAFNLADNGPVEKKLHNNIASSVKKTGVFQPASTVVKDAHDSDEKIDDAFLAKIESSNNVPKDKSAKAVSSAKANVPKSLPKQLETEAPLGTEEKDSDEAQKEAKAKDLDEEDDNGITIQPELERNEPGVLYQDKSFVDDHEAIAFNFEEADLRNIADYMEKIHHVKFVTEDILSPGGKGLAGHVVTFRTNKILTKKQSWDLFITFLHMAGLDVIPMMQAGFYKIVPFAKINGENIPTYIGVDVDTLPDDDMLVRFVYFARNIDPAKIQQILIKMQSGSAKLDVFSDLRALIFLDRASNIKSLMQIVVGLDQSILPESLSIVKIKRANVDDVIALYKSLKPGAGTNTAGTTQPQKIWAPGRKEPSLEYFPQDVALYSDKRTNSLILVGSDKSIKKIEEFVEKYIDADINRDSPPIYTYQLQYTNATDIQQLVSQLVTYGAGTASGGTAQDYGGVRNGIKYFSKMNILAEPHSNSLIINATKEDYEALLPLIKELDIPQKQIGLEVLIVQVNDSTAKTIGSQISGPGGPDSPVPAYRGAQTFAQNISAQTSGVLGFSNTNTDSSSGATGNSSAPVVISIPDPNNSNNTTYSIKSSLAALLGSSLNGVVNEPGAILVTFGKPIWALFKVLQSIVSVHIVANPFVVVSNNTQAKVQVGEQRRIIASQVVNAFGTTTSGTTPQTATLEFTITPQINKSNIVNLDINVQNNAFTIAGSQTSALMDNKQITTTASIANGEVLVLGGIMQESYTSVSRGVPFLEHIPLFGWFFKSKSKSVVKSHFLVFICPRVLESPDQKEAGTDAYTRYKMLEAQKEMDVIDDIDWFASKRDPIQKAFFGDTMPKTLQQIAGQSSAPKLARKKLQTKQKQKDSKTSTSKSSKIKSEKPLKEEKRVANSASDYISFEKDFLNPQANSSSQVKNSLSKGAQQGGVYV